MELSKLKIRVLSSVKWEIVYCSRPSHDPYYYYIFCFRLEQLCSYIRDGDQVASYNMAVFHRPDRFVQSVLQTYVRKEFKDLHACTLDAQVEWLPLFF